MPETARTVSVAKDPQMRGVAPPGYSLLLSFFTHFSVFLWIRILNFRGLRPWFTATLVAWNGCRRGAETISLLEISETESERRQVPGESAGRRGIALTF
jgi:hypothetical protein